MEIYRPKQQYEEASLEDIQKASKNKTAANRKAAVDEYPLKSSGRSTTRIAVKAGGAVANVVPGSVWRQGAFPWQPMAFALESERLNEKFYEPKLQDMSLRNFFDDPTEAMIYSIAGNPDDSKAKYFAAYLVAEHLRKLPEANVVWAPMYGGFDNPYLDSHRSSPTLIVLTNLTRDSTSTKLEKTRDIIEHYADIPRLIVSAGMDPISFASTRLFVPVHGFAYFSEQLVKARVAVI